MADYTTDIGQVRLTIGDVDSANSILEDAHITGYLQMVGENVKLAAAKALDAIASSEALLSKKINAQDISTDGPSVASDLRKHAAALRAEAKADAEVEDVAEYFEFIPNGPAPSAEGAESRYY